MKKINKKTEHGRVNSVHDNYIIRSTPKKSETIGRRRQIDPTTCERDYSDDEIEFMNAIDTYKRSSGRMFPTCSEILEVIRSLGYSKNTFSLLTGFSEPSSPFLLGPIGKEKYND